MIWLLFVLALLGVVAVGLACIAWSELKSDMEELAAGFISSRDDIDDRLHVSRARNANAMREINLLKERMDKLAQSRGLEWVPQRRVSGHYAASPHPIGVAGVSLDSWLNPDQQTGPQSPAKREIAAMAQQVQAEHNF